MKYISLDDDELGSEEYLRIVSSEEKHWKSIEDFYLSTFDSYPFIDRGDLSTFNSEIANKAQYVSRLSGFLLEHHEITLIGDELLITLCDDWNEQDYIIAIGPLYIRYYWETGA
ncbi:hypothetical protein MIB92_18995 [Aestuariirhabdus sp. Z084]|uniref:hypothetical protein n=1 Tax=Aestuariirhabdus haliotis TaxID=2918751 RepID=UPI00201B4235|nr:hypothetical protein [Aestuariirhabdus haliotis]MCL6417753.1 hypothetical protein [Aestuariirhabdus haliotis]MCL6421692.1 hypothetical protein [Aestuariirhabdus haliotis]